MVAGMHRHTAAKYIEAGKLPSEIVVERTWRRRADPFEQGIRASALRAAWIKGDKALLPYVIERAREKKHPEVRSLLVLVLAKLGGPEQFEAIVEFLSDQDARCRATRRDVPHRPRHIPS